MVTKVNKKLGPVRFYRLLLWCLSVKRYCYGVESYTLSEACAVVGWLYAMYGTIAVLFPL